MVYNYLMQTTNIEIGTEIYYTGDMVNASGFFRVTEQDTSAVYMEEIGGTRRFGVRPVQIGQVYNGTCNPRFVTEAARNAYVAARLPAVSRTGI